MGNSRNSSCDSLEDEMSEWLPISSAPRDGKYVIVTNGVYVLTAFFANEPSLWDRKSVPCWMIFDCEDYFYSVALDNDPPTHWQHLPKPPTGEGEK